MKNTLIFITFILIVLGVLFLISGKKYPRIPSDSIHRGLKKEIALCKECHGPHGKAPLGKDHPPKFDCFKCHKHPRK